MRKRKGSPTTELTTFGQRVRQERLRHRLTQEELGRRCGLRQPQVALIEAGEVRPTLALLTQLSRGLLLPIQFFLTGTTQPGAALPDLAIELESLGIADLLVGESRVPGAFRHPEEVVAWAVAGRSPDPRILEAVPAVLAWNAWREPLLRAFGRVIDPKVERRLAWLADVVLTLHRLEPLPGSVRDIRSLEQYVEGTPRPQDEDVLGGAGDEKALPPVYRRWRVSCGIRFAAFRERIEALHRLRPSTDG